jgi:carboxypeptidase C (cathepsin A)
MITDSMLMRHALSLACLSLLLELPPARLASGAEPPAANPSKPTTGSEEKKKEASDPGKAPVVTEHRSRIGTLDIEYRATTGFLPIKDNGGQVTAKMFYIAYTRSGQNSAKRPLTFSFNGGPGSSSVWMHMGLLGPKRVKLRDDGFALPPPYELVDNTESLLDETDLVFIDPVSTGLSRATKPEEAKKFHGVQEDARSVAEFIRLYLTRNDRWPSPKFLIGESYGTTRAAALSRELLQQHRLNLNGIMLVSTVLNFQTIWGGSGNDLPHVLYLPSFCATAWYHQKLEPALQKLPLKEVLAQAEAFAAGPYQQALLMGHALPETQFKTIASQVARFCGLSSEFVAANNLRISLNRFSTELLRDQRLVCGRFDSRYTNFTRDPLSPFAESDPSADAIFSAYASTFHHYLRETLRFEDDEPYHILGNVGPWNWDAENEYADLSEALAATMNANPFLRVHVSSGFFDLATPYFASRYTMNHLRLHPKLMANITMDDYQAGHMMYLNLPDLKKQKADLARFIQQASAR